MSDWIMDAEIQKFNFESDILDIKTFFKKDNDDNPYIEMHFMYPKFTLKIHKIPVGLMRGEVSTYGYQSSGELTLNLSGDEENILYSIEGK